MKKHVILILVMLVSNLLGVIAQELDSVRNAILYSSSSNATGPFMPQVIPPTPQSAIYQKYLSHKIDECNGIPDISIPLYNLEIKGMKIPIILSYHASGVKRHQYDGDVGAGWSINVGGFKVMRTIYGQEDEKAGKYSNSNWQSRYVNIYPDSPAQQRLEKDRYLGDLTSNAILDGEYDHFSYILPSSSGNFIIQDCNKPNLSKALIAESKRDKILFASVGNSLRNMTITDGEGFVYQMGINNIRESSWDNHIVGWPLIKMTTPNNEEVNFEYKEYGTHYNEYLTTRLSYTEAPFYTNWKSYNSPIQEDLYGDQYVRCSGLDSSLFYAQLISKITAPNCKIIFVRRSLPISAPSESANKSWNHLISNIEIYNSNNDLVKRISFDYDLVSNFGYCKHNLLKSIIINDQQSFPQEKYQFSYYPDYSSYTNEWGYGGTRAEFHELFKNFSLLSKKAIIIGMDEYNQIQNLPSTESIFFCNRSNSNNTVNNEYSLKRITFPTGGFTEYEYEQHQAKYGNEIGGLRIKKITSNASESSTPFITEFQYDNAKFEYGLSAIDFGEELYTIGFKYEPYIQFMLYKGSRTLIVSTTPIQEELLDCRACYGKVTTLQYDQHRKMYNGKTVSIYDNIPPSVKKEIPRRAYFTPFAEDNAITLQFPTNGDMLGRGYWIDSYLGYEPTLKNRTYFDKNNKSVKKEEYTYSDIQKGVFQELRVLKRISANDVPAPFSEIELYKYVSSCYDYIEYDLHLGFHRLNTKRTTEYNGNGAIISNESFSYNQNHQLVEKTTDVITEKYKYPEDFAEPVYNSMVAANILSPIIEKISYNRVIADNEIGRTKTNYIWQNNIYLPLSIQTKVPNENYRTNIFFDLYDTKGNILQYTTLDGISTVYLWSYNAQYPIAEIKNMTYSQITRIINEATLNTISSRFEPTVSDWVLINNLRSNPAMANAYITTYTYKPLIGMLTATDPSGTTIYYEYDFLGRLICIKDHAGKIIEEYKYYYTEP